MKKSRRNTAGSRRPPRGDRFAAGQPALLPIVSAPWWQWWLPALLVAAAVLVVYWPTLDNDFVNWDDPDYLKKNDYVSDWQGLSRI